MLGGEAKDWGEKPPEGDHRKNERWTNVGSRRRKRASKRVSAFFLSNLPEAITGEELWNECRSFGHIVDTHIPKKKDSSKVGQKVGRAVNTGVGVKANQQIGQSFGKVLEYPTASPETGNLAFEEVGILVDSPLRISGSVNLEWKGMNYPVWVQKTSRCWDPGFIKNPIASESSSSATSPDGEGGFFPAKTGMTPIRADGNNGKNIPCAGINQHGDEVPRTSQVNAGLDFLGNLGSDLFGLHELIFNMGAQSKKKKKAHMISSLQKIIKMPKSYQNQEESQGQSNNADGPGGTSLNSFFQQRGGGGDGASPHIGQNENQNSMNQAREDEGAATLGSRVLVGWRNSEFYLSISGSK
ncbi:hypothetical protein L1987_81117 [Smallanthus sonchifolius]|uniref:Uncharacterized protein n=1 Tax=Smallanthus sonchifolius TaxID=185202 RepID=A0ACB8YQA0_9ASTR|nr:hypothetical protein L1987_81117 [Smallanthus sonchifolius]